MKKLGLLLALFAVVGFATPSFSEEVKKDKASVEEMTGRDNASCSVVFNGENDAKQTVNGELTDSDKTDTGKAVHE
ncbi:MAG: hypothetical protein A3B70_04460 [Deltaproteobacteria bacterium RIFCSPHIGHO2_02_FULL_40_11]|nr:MAG: hypothetical protein A3B70_04460 [Deltaproteobacteria bacterium RIFCSPHIGHO2_02_FULL_40_11]